MKRTLLLFLSTISFMFAVNAYSEDVPSFTNEDLQRYSGKGGTASGKQDISGTWKFVCCSGKYWGEIDLAVDKNNRITGRFYDMANKSGGAVDGTLNGKTVTFTRNNGEQDYKLVLSDDGTAMSGFFVGVHDGSAGTEVTLTRSNLSAQPADAAQEGILTTWKEGPEFGKEMDKYWKDGYYPALAEGRTYDGRSQFRARVRPFPKRVWWFYWWYDQLPNQYEEHRKKMIAEGFTEIHVQVFTDGQGAKQYQTCWIKYGS